MHKGVAHSQCNGTKNGNKLISASLAWDGRSAHVEIVIIDSPVHPRSCLGVVTLHEGRGDEDGGRYAVWSSHLVSSRRKRENETERDGNGKMERREETGTPARGEETGEETGKVTKGDERRPPGP